MAMSITKTAQLVNDVLDYISTRYVVPDDLRDVMTTCRNDMIPKRKKRVVTKQTVNSLSDTSIKSLRALTITNLYVQDKVAEFMANGVRPDPLKGNILKQAATSWNDLTDDARQTYKEANAERLISVNDARKRGVRTPGDSSAVRGLSSASDDEDAVYYHIIFNE